MDFQPTAEQQKALDLFAGGGHLAIQAGAGTGKSATLKLIAHDFRDKRVAYTAFNKAIVESMRLSMAEAGYRHVRCRTMHGFAFDAVGHLYKTRQGARMAPKAMAKLLGLNSPIWVPQIGGGQKGLAPGWQASFVIAALRRFCQTADAEPALEHFRYLDGVDAPDPKTGKRTFRANNMLRKALLPALRWAWQDAVKVDGMLPYNPAYFLKMFQLGMHPGDLSRRGSYSMGAEILMIDEAQDMAPVMLGIIKTQMRRGTRVVLVGDSAQAINSFTGAVDAFKNITVDNTCYLTRSFRFGQDIADFANTILAQLDTPLRLVGKPGGPDDTGYIGPCSRPDVILTRTNAVAVSEALTLMAAGQRVNLVGNTAKMVVTFAKAAADLRENGWTAHPELGCFSSWKQVQDYAEHDELGGDLKLMVDLIDRFGTDAIIAGLANIADPRDADITVCTAHQSKGLQWQDVKLASDFPAPGKLNEDELMLLYVAVTRAQDVLDVTACPSFAKAPDTIPAWMAAATV
ncbi:UvrD-helicase domain-containing protein [Frankia sp. AgB32]|uniref:UvrD-helicase domain-containing protein n=1 Tax=Frankia sp. AgB32 TaxID=631119 RepID=UPI00200CD8E8|nr:UvrD-helicase domain-containing protein [Frankia sp. AgB32]MCK9894702.1 AAA family ATPase [Frankia sp. AgB32]